MNPDGGAAHQGNGSDARANQGMCVAFTLISILGIIVFFKVADHPVGGLFIGLTCIYVSDFFASTGPAPDRATFIPARLAFLGEKALGFFHIATGLWLMYLMFADILDAVVKFTLPI